MPSMQEIIKGENVLILGNGWAGNEAFKATFWTGQSLNTELNITVASKNATKYRNFDINPGNERREGGKWTGFG